MRYLMKPIGWPLAAALAAGVAGTTPTAAPAQQVSATAPLVQLATGRGRLVTLARPMSDVFVANSETADVQVRSPTQLYVFGKKPGETTISATSKSGQVVYAATVRVGNNYNSLNQMLGLALPDSQVKATTLNGVVLLTGTLVGPEDGAEAERLVTAFVGEGTKVISRFKTATPLQVNLQVRFAEVTRSFSKQIGVNLASFDGTGGFKFGVAQGGRAIPQYNPGGPLATGFTTGGTGISILPGATGATTLGLAGRLLGLDLLGAIDLGENIGAVTTLANPNLTALSGETGTFLAGGEIPIPLAQGLGAVSVEYKQYGVSLSYTPTVLSDGRISLRVRPEVSQLDYANAVTLGGTRVPGITTRRAETTVELGSGQSFMIGGLLQSGHNNGIQKAPFLGDIPILGSLFRSNTFQRNESELVIIITPYLVRPVNANSIALPTDGYKAPTDAERVLLGKAASGTSGAERPRPVMLTPPEGRPTLGAAAPVLPMPMPTPDTLSDRAAAQPTKPKKGKSAAAAPGFSTN